MRVPIRWKLTFSILLPLLLVAGVSIGINFAMQRRDAFRETERLLRVEADLASARLNGLFERVAQIAQASAGSLSLQERLTVDEVYRHTQLNLSLDPMVYGSCVAFAPDQFEPGVRLFAPYAHRHELGERLMDVKDAYDYTQPEWEWFDRPRRTLQPCWTEPFFDEGAGNVVMCTYSAPFVDAHGEFRGVATVDVSLETLQRTQRPLSLPGALFVILSREGTIVSDRDPSLIMRENVWRLAETLGRPEIADVARRMLAGETGVMRIPGFFEDEPVFLVYAPIPSTGWGFAATVPEREVMAPVYASLSERTLTTVVGLALVLATVLIVSFWFTKPISRLAAAVRRLGAGDLDAEVGDVRTRDEVGDLARAFNAMIAQLKEHVAALTRETAARESVESEIRVARSIQTSLLPRTFPPFPDRAEFALHAVNAPARRVAGDFFDYFFVDDQRLCIVMADVSGKGVPAAMFMAVARTIVRHLASNGLAPQDVLKRASESLLADNDTGLFLTIFIGVIDVNTGEMRYANGGHPLPLRINASGGVSPFGEVTGTLVGVIPDAAWESRTGRLAPGEKLIMFTDGFPEALSPNGEFFGEPRFRDLIQRLSSRSVEDLCREAVEQIDAFQSGARKDDITLLVFERAAAPGAPSATV